MSIDDKIVAGYVSRGQGAGPLLVAERAGCFTDEGLTVEIRLLDGSTKQTEALLSGEVLFGNMAAPGLLSAVLDGADLVFITGGINQQFLVGRPGRSTLQELAAGVIGVHREGQLPDYLARIVIDRMELLGYAPPHRVMGMDQGASIAGLVRGELDAVALSPPAAIEARRNGCSFILDFADWGLNYTLGGLVARRSTIQEQPQLVHRFVRAYVCGMHRYKTDRELAVGVQQDYSHIDDRSIAEETYDTTQPGMPRAPYPVTSGLRILVDAMHRVEPRAVALDPELLVDPAFVGELDRSGFIEGLYSR